MSLKLVCYCARNFGEGCVYLLLVISVRGRIDFKWGPDSNYTSDPDPNWSDFRIRFKVIKVRFRVGFGSGYKGEILRPDLN